MIRTLKSQVRSNEGLDFFCNKTPFSSISLYFSLLYLLGMCSVINCPGDTLCNPITLKCDTGPKGISEVILKIFLIVLWKSIALKRNPTAHLRLFILVSDDGADEFDFDTLSRVVKKSSKRGKCKGRRCRRGWKKHCKKGSTSDSIQNILKVLFIVLLMEYCYELRICLTNPNFLV